MTIKRDAKQLKKWYERAVLNVARKIFNAETRRVALVEQGKTVVVTETQRPGQEPLKTYSLPPAPVEPPTPPRLSWLGGKQYAQQGDSRKNRSGRGPEQAEAWPENASRTLAKEIDKALLPVEPVTVPAPEVGEVTQ